MISKRYRGHDRARLTLAAALAVSVLGASTASGADAPKNAPQSAARTPAQTAAKGPAKGAPKARAAQHFSFAGKRPSFRQEGTTKSDVAVSALDSEGLLTLQDEIWYPDFSVAPHYHKQHHETFYVVSGRVEWTVNGETHAMGAGDSVHIPANTVHSVKVLDGKNAHMLMIYSPGGYEEHMAREEAYTIEQLKDPKLRDELRRLNDFHPVEK